MKKLSIILIITSFFNCSEPNQVNYDSNIDIGVTFSVFNSENKDLLNPKNTNHINTSRIRLFYDVNGKKKEIYNPNMDSPKSFRIYKHENEYRIAISLNYTKTSNKATTYIEWNKDDTDTIKASYEKDQSMSIIMQDTIWLNGKQIWKRSDNVAPHIVLIK